MGGVEQKRKYSSAQLGLELGKKEYFKEHQLDNYEEYFKMYFISRAIPLDVPLLSNIPLLEE